MSATASPAAPFLVTMGEPAGIGGELTLMAWRAAQARRLPPFATIDDAKRLEALARKIAIDVPIIPISAPDEAIHVFAKGLPVLDQPLTAPVAPGVPEPGNAPQVIGAIERAVAMTLNGEAAGLITNPIHKESLYAAGFTAPGHTEFLAHTIAALTHRPPRSPVMMLTARDLKVVPVTIHQPLKDAIATLSTPMIVEAARITAAALRQDFALDTPRLAVAGLNPHAGEGGTLGREEIDIITPAVTELRGQGLRVEGPFPADTLFHDAARKAHDAVLCMYHDQALIPVKTIDFWGGVNVTLGLDIVRTSPDHGTAFALAGTGKANPESFFAALCLAAEIAGNRARHGRG